MAKNILKAGHQMTVFDLQPEATAPLEAPADLKGGEEDEPRRGPRKGNPRRLSKKDRATQRALGRLGPGLHRPRVGQAHEGDPALSRAGRRTCRLSRERSGSPS